MDIDLVFKIAAIGIVVAVLNQLLVRSDRPDQAMLVSLAGLVTTMMTHSANIFSKSSIAQNPKSVLTSSKSELISRTSSIIVVTSPARLTSIA